MDLSSLPLMPSLDLPPAAPAPAPEAARPYADTGWQPEERAAEGCSSCQQLRERDRSASSMRQQYGASIAQPPPIVWVNDLSPIESIFDMSIASAPADRIATMRWADAFGDSVTGRISTSQPAMANIPRAAPPVQSSRRIRGRYDFDDMDNAAIGLQGQYVGVSRAQWTCMTTQ